MSIFLVGLAGCLYLIAGVYCAIVLDANRERNIFRDGNGQVDPVFFYLCVLFWPVYLLVVLLIELPKRVLKDR